MKNMYPAAGYIPDRF